MRTNGSLYHSKWIFISFLFLIPLIVLPHASTYRKSPEPPPKYGGTFRMKAFASGFNPQLDPVSPSSYIFISEQIYDGLVHLDKNLNPMPALAEYWSISSDGTKYKFYLKKGVKFHHGTELTAEDVKFSLERILDKSTESPYYLFFVTRVLGAREFREGKATTVKGYQILDKYIFEITWTKPYYSSLYLLSMPFCKILPRDKIISDGSGFFRKPSGTGPFKFDYYLRTNKLEIAGVHLIRNDEYFGEPAYLDAVEFCPLFTLDHFMNEEIDSTPVISNRLLNSDYQIYQDDPLTHLFLGMSCHIPPLDNPSLRRAISLMLNKPAIADAASGIKSIRRPINNYIPSRVPGFIIPNEKISRNPDEAFELLTEAGFSEEKSFPSLNFFIDEPRTESKYEIFKEVSEQLSPFGIRVRLRYYSTLNEVKTQSSPYLILIGHLLSMPDPEDMIRPLFYSESTFNVFGYTNPQLDEFLTLADTERSRTKRTELFHLIEEILYWDVPAIPLYSYQNRIAMQPYVRGVEVPPMGLYYLDASKIWLDK